MSKDKDKDHDEDGKATHWLKKFFGIPIKITVAGQTHSPATLVALKGIYVVWQDATKAPHLTPAMKIDDITPVVTNPVELKP